MIINEKARLKELVIKYANSDHYADVHMVLVSEPRNRYSLMLDISINEHQKMICEVVEEITGIRCNGNSNEACFNVLIKYLMNGNKLIKE